MTETKLVEQVVMTPKCKSANSTTLIIERKAVEAATTPHNNDKTHVAGGQHSGIVINKEAVIGELLIKACGKLV